MPVEATKDDKRSEILPYLQGNTLAGFEDAGRRHDTPGSETEDLISHNNVRS